MFKICIAVLLQIIQFSTDEETLKAVQALDPVQEQIERPAGIDQQASKTFEGHSALEEQMLCWPGLYFGDSIGDPAFRAFSTMECKSVVIAL